MNSLDFSSVHSMYSLHRRNNKDERQRQQARHQAGRIWKFEWLRSNCEKRACKSYVLVRHERRARLRDSLPAFREDISLPSLVNDAGYAFKGMGVVGGRASGRGHLCIREICCGLDSEIVGNRREHYDCSKEEQAKERQGKQECSAARHGEIYP